MFHFQLSFSFMPHNRLIIFPFHRYIHSQEYLYEHIIYDRISLYWLSTPIFANLSLLCLLRLTLEYLQNLRHSEIWDNVVVRGATHKLKPSPFHLTPVLWKLHVVFHHLTVYMNSHPQIVIPPRATRSSNQEEDPPVREVETDSPSTSAGCWELWSDPYL